ncbi:VOC family protein [Massilia violaceinigra]|uniref:VOC family protein n=1 Tax=Massilia violaceinigra TaxID=2045208 RepID=A0ABY4ADH8_9BURK|nr:VOC family protein [Massilia violaceinigra]UOD32806.1 VOC family protein [Massilia violaceinigra]
MPDRHVEKTVQWSKRWLADKIKQGHQVVDVGPGMHLLKREESMRIDVLLRAESAADTIRFYVEELGMFRVDADYGMESYLLRAIANPAICLQIAPWHPPARESPVFALTVPSCDSQFQRLRAMRFAGGRLVPDKNGVLEVFEWPGGKSFMLEDPAKNRFLLCEDRIAPV